MKEFMAELSISKGFVKCYWYDGRISGKKFVKFIGKQLICFRNSVNMFLKRNNKNSKLINQDGDILENYKISKKAVKKVGCRSFQISTR